MLTTREVPRRMPALDGLRFLAALSVAVFHVLAVGGQGVGATGVNVWGGSAAETFGHPAYFAASYGWVGVPLFFLISGFVICMSSWGRTARQFAVSRFVRLFPAYWLAVLLSFAVLSAYPRVFTPLSVRDTLINLTMFQSSLGVPDLDSVYWTLGVELRFYLLFLIVVWLGVTFWRVVTFCLIWTAASFLSVEINEPHLMDLLVPHYSQFFIAGVALFLMYRHGSHWVLWLILGLSWVLSLHNNLANGWQDAHGQPTWPARVLITGCFGVMLLLALGKLDRLRWRGLTALGATTYPLYLLHNVIGNSVVDLVRPRLRLDPWVLLPIALLAVIGLAWLVDRLIERPLAPVLKRALSWSPQPRRGVPATAAGVQVPVQAGPVDVAPTGPRPVPRWHRADARRRVLRRAESPAVGPPALGEPQPSE